MDLALWSEFLPYSQVESVLPTVDQQGAGIFLAVNEKSLESEDFYRMWSSAAARGLKIRPWLLLSEEEGYWANKWNAATFEKFVWRFLGKLKERGLSTQWITIDLESPPDMSRALAHALAKSDYLKVWKIFSKAAKDGSFFDAQNIYRGLVERLHAEGIKVHAVTNPFVLHDICNHEYRIQNAMGTPVQDIPWDEISFMVYRAEYEKFLGKMSEDLVYAYAKLARRYFGDKAGIDLGEIGMVTFPEVTRGYSDPFELTKDFAATRAAGINRIHVYALDGFMPIFKGQPETIPEWFTMPEGKKPRPDLRIRFYLGMVDFITGFLPKATH